MGDRSFGFVEASFDILVLVLVYCADSRGSNRRRPVFLGFDKPCLGVFIPVLVKGAVSQGIKSKKTWHATLAFFHSRGYWSLYCDHGLHCIVS